MNWKEFLKPSIKKIAIFLLLFIAISFIIYFFVYTPWIIADFTYTLAPFGIPLTIWSDFLISGFSWINFIIDIVFWYLVSCLIVFAFQKLSKK